MGRAPGNAATAIEAKVTSKGQITLPKLIRERLGIQTGSRIRFIVDAAGQLLGDPVRYELEDLWAAADPGPWPKRPMSAAQMDAAKARRRW